MAGNVNIRTLLGFVIVALVVALAVMIARNFKGFETTEILDNLPANVDLAMKRIQYTETQDGVPQWALQADSATHSFSQGATDIENIHMVFYDQGELGDVTLTADRGKFFSDPQVVQVEGNVAVKSPEGYTFYTDALTFTAEDRYIRTDDDVRLLSGAADIKGNGMLLHIDTRKISVLRRVSAVIEGQGGGL